MNIAYIDFDGTLADTPMPDIGKQLWSQYYNQPFPAIGWWGRLESMDPNVFTILTKKEVHDLVVELHKHNYVIKILTSRLPKFTDRINEILKYNGISFINTIITKTEKSKGEQILEDVKNQLKSEIVTNVKFYDDRQKEIDSVGLIKDDLHILGVTIDIIKVYNPTSID